MIYSKVSDLIGSTPLFDLGKYNNSNIYAKLEMIWFFSKDQLQLILYNKKADENWSFQKDGGTYF